MLKTARSLNVKNAWKALRGSKDVATRKAATQMGAMQSTAKAGKSLSGYGKQHGKNFKDNLAQIGNERQKGSFKALSRNTAPDIQNTPAKNAFLGINNKMRGAA